MKQVRASNRALIGHQFVIAKCPSLWLAVVAEETKCFRFSTKGKLQLPACDYWNIKVLKRATFHIIRGNNHFVRYLIVFLSKAHRKVANSAKDHLIF